MGHRNIIEILPSQGIHGQNLIRHSWRHKETKTDKLSVKQQCGGELRSYLDGIYDVKEDGNHIETQQLDDRKVYFNQH